MMKLARNFALINLLLAWTAVPAMAAPMGVFEAFSANTHSFWIPGIDEHLDFAPAGNLVVGPTEWSLTGRVSNGNIAFDVSAIFSDITDMAGAIADHPMAPKKELASTSYIADGGPIDPATWAYAKVLTGTLTGVPGSTYAGSVFGLSRRGPSGQWGYGANGKNHDLGLSVWYDLTLLQNPLDHDLRDAYTGDINISSNPIPEPGAASLFAVGFLIFGCAVRRNRVTT